MLLIFWFEIRIWKICACHAFNKNKYSHWKWFCHIFNLNIQHWTSNWFSILSHTQRRNLRIFHSFLIRMWHTRESTEWRRVNRDKEICIFLILNLFGMKKKATKNHKSMLFSLFQSESHFPFYFLSSFFARCLTIPIPINQYLLHTQYSVFNIQYWILYRNFGTEMFSMLWLMVIPILDTRSLCVCALYKICYVYCSRIVGILFEIWGRLVLWVIRC